MHVLRGRLPANHLFEATGIDMRLEISRYLLSPENAQHARNVAGCQLGYQYKVYH